MCGGRELKVFGNDGKTTTTSCKWTIAQLDEKQVVIEWSDVKENGNPKPDFKMSVRRTVRRKTARHQKLLERSVSTPIFLWWCRASLFDDKTHDQPQDCTRWNSIHCRFADPREHYCGASSR